MLIFVFFIGTLSTNTGVGGSFWNWWIVAPDFGRCTPQLPLGRLRWGNLNQCRPHHCYQKQGFQKQNLSPALKVFSLQQINCKTSATCHLNGKIWRRYHSTVTWWWFKYFSDIADDNDKKLFTWALSKIGSLSLSSPMMARYPTYFPKQIFVILWEMPTSL